MDSIRQNIGMLLEGSLFTLGTAGFGVLVSLSLGTLLGVVSALRVPVLRYVIGAYTEIIRNTPELVQLFWIYLVLPTLGVRLSVLEAVLLYLSINGVAYTSMVVRGGIENLPVGQHEASRALGMGRTLMFRRVLVPQALRPLVPSLVNEIIRILKNTTLVTLIAAPDLIHTANRLANITFEPIAFQLFTAAFYFIVITLLSFVANKAIPER